MFDFLKLNFNFTIRLHHWQPFDEGMMKKES